MARRPTQTLTVTIPAADEAHALRFAAVVLEHVQAVTSDRGRPAFPIAWEVRNLSTGFVVTFDALGSAAELLSVTIDETAAARALTTLPWASVATA